MTTVGEGICQIDNTTSPAAESPASIKNIIEIRVMSFPYPRSHFGPLILASVFGHACFDQCHLSRLQLELFPTKGWKTENNYKLLKPDNATEFKNKVFMTILCRQLGKVTIHIIFLGPFCKIVRGQGRFFYSP